MEMRQNKALVNSRQMVQWFWFNCPTKAKALSPFSTCCVHSAEFQLRTMQAYVVRLRGETLLWQQTGQQFVFRNTLIMK